VVLEVLVQCGFWQCSEVDLGLMSGRVHQPIDGFKTWLTLVWPSDPSALSSSLSLSLSFPLLVPELRPLPASDPSTPSSTSFFLRFTRDPVVDGPDTVALLALVFAPADCRGLLLLGGGIVFGVGELTLIMFVYICWGGSRSVMGI
jgi:hypothetical protein